MVSREDLWKHICFTIMCIVGISRNDCVGEHVAKERGLVQSEKKRRKAPRQHVNSHHFIDIVLFNISGRMFLFKNVASRGKGVKDDHFR